MADDAECTPRRIAELTYTASDSQDIAREIGDDDAPFVRDEERPFLDLYEAMETGGAI